MGRGLFSLGHKQLLLCASDRRVKPRTGSWRRTQAPRAPWPMFSEFLVNPSAAHGPLRALCPAASAGVALAVASSEPLSLQGLPWSCLWKSPAAVQSLSRL